MLFWLALGSASFPLAINLDPSPAKAIPVSLHRKEKPAPKKSPKVAGVSLSQASGTMPHVGGALTGNKKPTGK
jgi:hypothetical protein